MALPNLVLNFINEYLPNDLNNIVMNYTVVCEILFTNRESILVTHNSLIDILTKINNDDTIDNININCYTVLILNII